MNKKTNLTRHSQIVQVDVTCDEHVSYAVYFGSDPGLARIERYHETDLSLVYCPVFIILSDTFLLGINVPLDFSSSLIIHHRRGSFKIINS